jgi:hypothetical protein
MDAKLAEEDLSISMVTHMMGIGRTIANTVKANMFFSELEKPMKECGVKGKNMVKA